MTDDTSATPDGATETAPATPELVPTAKRPGWPKAVGILSIVFGSLGLLCGVGGVAMIPFSASMMGQALQDIPPPPTMQLSPTLIAAAGLGALVNLLLIVAGFMTIGRKGLGRTLHLVYAILAVLASLVGLYTQLQMQAGMEGWLEQYGDREVAPNSGMTWHQQAAMGQQFQGVGLAVGMALTLAWPIFCIVWFGMVKRDVDAMGADLPEQDELY